MWHASETWPHAYRVVVFDTTLRDGEQAPGFSMRVAGEARSWPVSSSALGVDIIEAGFPIASPGRCRVGAPGRRQRCNGPTIAALARCAPGDIERAGKAIEPAARKGRIHTFIATSDLHLERKLRISREQCLETRRRRP